MPHQTTYRLHMLEQVAGNSISYTYLIRPIDIENDLSRDILLDKLKAYLADNYQEVVAHVRSPQSFEIIVDSYRFECSLEERSEIGVDHPISHLQKSRMSMPHTGISIGPSSVTMQLSATSDIPDSVPVITDVPPTETPEQVLISIPNTMPDMTQEMLTIDYECVALYVGGPYLGDYAHSQSTQPAIVNQAVGKHIPVPPDRIPGKEAALNESRVIANGQAVFYRDNTILTESRATVGFSETHDQTGKPKYVSATNARTNHYGKNQIACFSATGFAQVFRATPIAQLMSRLGRDAFNAAVKGGTPGPYFEVVFHPIEEQTGETIDVLILFRGSCFPRMILNVDFSFPHLRTKKSCALYVDPTSLRSAVNGAAYEKLFSPDSFEVIYKVRINKSTGETLYPEPDDDTNQVLFSALHQSMASQNPQGTLYARRMMDSCFAPGCVLGHSQSALRYQLKHDLAMVQSLFKVWGRKLSYFERLGAWANGIDTIKTTNVKVVRPATVVHCLIGESYRELFSVLQHREENEEGLTGAPRLDIEELIKLCTSLFDSENFADLLGLLNDVQIVELAQFHDQLQEIQTAYASLLQGMQQILFEPHEYLKSVKSHHASFLRRCAKEAKRDVEFILNAHHRTICHAEVKDAMRRALGLINRLSSLLEQIGERFSGEEKGKIFLVLNACYEAKHTLEYYHARLLLSKLNQLEVEEEVLVIHSEIQESLNASIISQARQAVAGIGLSSRQSNQSLCGLLQNAMHRLTGLFGLMGSGCRRWAHTSDVDMSSSSITEIQEEPNWHTEWAIVPYTGQPACTLLHEQAESTANLSSEEVAQSPHEKNLRPIYHAS